MSGLVMVVFEVLAYWRFLVDAFEIRKFEFSAHLHLTVRERRLKAYPF